MSALGRMRDHLVRRRPISPLRASVGITLAAVIVTRPVHLVSIRWWRVPEVVEGIGLTTAQRHAIDLAYERVLPARGHCAQHVFEARSRLDRLIEDRVSGDAVLRQTEAVAAAATEEQVLIRSLDEEIARLLSPRAAQATDGDV